MLQYPGPSVLKMPDEAWFIVNMVQKDVLIAWAAGRRTLRTTSRANEKRTSARVMGLAVRDFGMIFRVWNELPGVSK